MIQHVVKRLILVPMSGLGQQVDDDLGIAGGLENVPNFLVISAEKGGVDEVAVVGDGDLSACEGKEQWLGVGFGASARGRVSAVAYGDAAANLFEGFAIENLVDQSQSGVAEQVFAVGRNDARGFLASVLLGVEA